MLTETEGRLSKAEARLNNIIRVGVVSSINPGKCTATVAFQEFGNLVTYDLPIVVKQSLSNKDYWLPDINEQVICVFLPIGIETGFILGSIYSSEDEPVIANPNKRSMIFSDGTSVEYDRSNHELTINVVSGKVNITAETAHVTASTTITGDLIVEGNIGATGNVSDGVSTIQAMRDIYNSHTNPNDGPPPQQM